VVYFESLRISDAPLPVNFAARHIPLKHLAPPRVL
jgi:hypothetical protein